MDKRAIRTPEGAREIIEYNTNIIYHLPPKYKSLNVALKGVREDLLKILKFCKNNEPIIWKQKYVWFLDNKRLVGLRKRMGRATANRHFNYLSCIGVINKLSQTENNRTAVNATFLLNERENGKIRDINTFTIYKYSEKKLEEMEARAAELLKNKITPGNISNDMLKAHCCLDLAAEVFYANSENSIHDKEKDFQKVLEMLQKLCDKKGYTNKRELCSYLEWNRDKLDNILKIFSDSWKQNYQYKAPNKIETEKYNLKSKAWIIIKK